MTGTLAPEDVTLDGDLIRIGGDSVVIKTFISSIDVAEDSYTSRIEGLLALGDRDAALEVALSEDRTATLTISTIGGQSTSFQFCDYLSARKAANKIAEMINGTYAGEDEDLPETESEPASWYYLYYDNEGRGFQCYDGSFYRATGAEEMAWLNDHRRWFVTYRDVVVSASPAEQHFVGESVDSPSMTPLNQNYNYPH